jgi:transcriptional regulator of NAD metabolism
MYSAKDVHEIAVKTQTEQTELKRQRTIKALEGSISTKIHQAALTGEFSVSLEIGHLLDFCLIVETLKNNGYQVITAGKILKILW